MELLAAGSIFGHLLLDLLKQLHVVNGQMNSALVIPQILTTVFLLLLEMIISVRVVYTPTGLTIILWHSIPMISSGMVWVVHPPAHAASSTTLYGSLRIYIMQQLMTLNFHFKSFIT